MKTLNNQSSFLIQSESFWNKTNKLETNLTRHTSLEDEWSNHQIKVVETKAETERI